MTQRPSGSPNAGRMNCFPTKTSQPFLSQPILSQSPALFQAGGGDDPWSWTPPAFVRAKRNESASNGSESGIGTKRSRKPQHTTSANGTKRTSRSTPPRSSISISTGSNSCSRAKSPCRAGARSRRRNDLAPGVGTPAVELVAVVMSASGT
jgi:hypothetical protein